MQWSKKPFMQAQRALPEVSSGTSVDSTAQTGHAGVTDWQEDCHQKIQSMKELYFTELSEFHQKIAQKLQQHEALMPPGKQSEQYDKLKSFKAMLERTLTLLQISKTNIPVGMKDKLPTYEKQIVTMLQNHRIKKATPQPQAQQFQHPGGSHSMPQQQPSQVTQLQQPDNHGNQLQQINMQGSGSSMQLVGGSGMQHVSVPLPTHLGGSTTQQNISNALQPGSSIDAVQGSSYNSLQPGSFASGKQGGVGSLPNAVSAPQQNTMSQNAGNNLQSSISPMQSSSNLLQQQQQQHLKQQQQEQHQLLQTQQMQQIHQRHMQQQLIQQQQRQQLLQQQQPMQQQLQQQQKQKQTSPLPIHQMQQQLHSMSELNELKMRQGTGIKPGLPQHYLGSQRQNYYHQQLKPGATFPASSPQNLQAPSPQISHHSSPQIEQSSLLPSVLKSDPLQAANSPFIVSSPSTPFSSSSIPGDSEKQISVISSVPNAGHISHPQIPIAPNQTQSLVGTPGISASPLLAEWTSQDGNQPNVLATSKQRASERPLERLIKVVQLSTPKALSSSVSDIGSVVTMIDRVAGSAPGNGSRAAVGEDLVAMTKCRLQAKNFMSQDGGATTKKMKRHTSAMPLNNVSSAGSVNDSFKQLHGLESSELESTATSRIKRHKTEVNHSLLEEIREINQHLIDTVVDVSDEDADSVAAASEGVEGTVVKCSFTAVALSSDLKAQFASAQKSPITPLRLLVPTNYPKCSPVLLDKLPVDTSKESENLSTKAKSKFSISLRCLSQPMSLREMVRTWDACAREVILEYAQQSGGGSFSSTYGCWEICLGA
ncbi:mediator of RNA polymerase II transcription subunit 15a [Iris pallida]|uniref:Mediator of RNA polymerase II transcription subunit 15a n=1 Tax=Iris pallida TaxID=29817 RepID=A0AAX6HPX3_IRIPA|nr:mediator of RNA polymerase II transcription subunit 15a [Iris pallida]